MTVSEQRLHVDWTACDRRGLCVELLPELLGRDEWGYPIVRSGSRTAQVPPGLLAEAREAVRVCPVRALRLIS